MAIYAIGDVQGCFVELQKLLEAIQFHPDKDTLWFTGDLVNRGPASLEVLRFVKKLGKQHVFVLGNHDLHLLALAQGVGKAHPNDTLASILTASDKEELMSWLSERPLLHYENGYAMTHAGLAPAWPIQKAVSLAQEVESTLQGASKEIFLSHMYGNSPDVWDDKLTGTDRLRCITNYLTRMRFCYEDGRLELQYKGKLSDKPQELVPWFDVKDRKNKEIKIIFGHWAALGGKADVPNVYPLDTGCVWGHYLTAMRLEDGKKFQIKSMTTFDK